jgi:hypothetical protein
MSVNQQKTRLICFRVTESEFQLLDQRWKIDGWRSMSEYLRKRVSGLENVPASPEPSEVIRRIQLQIEELRSEIARIEGLAPQKMSDSQTN